MSPCDNCGSAAPDNKYETVYDGEKHCESCMKAFRMDSLVSCAEPIVFSLDYDAICKLDAAFGVIHEHLPEYFKLTKMANIQSINSKKLSTFPN